MRRRTRINPEDAYAALVAAGLIPPDQPSSGNPIQDLIDLGAELDDEDDEDEALDNPRRGSSLLRCSGKQLLALAKGRGSRAAAAKREIARRSRKRR